MTNTQSALGRRNSESGTGAKQLVARAQPLKKEIGKGFYSSNALECSVRQYPNVGVEFVHWFSQTHKLFFIVGKKAQEHSHSHAVANGFHHTDQTINPHNDVLFGNAFLQPLCLRQVSE